MIINFKELGAGQGGVSSGDVQSIIESYNYVNSGEVETQITAKGYLTSADTQNFVSTTDFEEANEVISTALNDLNDRMSNIPSGSSNNAPIFIDSADTTNKANEIWEAIMNDGYVPEVVLKVNVNGYLKNVRLNAYEEDIADGYLYLSFQYENTNYLLTISYANSAATLSDFTSSQFGVNTNGSILGVRKVAQTAYNELVASGETDETTAYYVVPDEQEQSGEE